jgi:hypothetical protein
LGFWALGQTPNPQSPIPNPQILKKNHLNLNKIIII